MHFFHLSDLHIGKQLYGYSLLEDQEWILTEIDPGETTGRCPDRW